MIPWIVVEFVRDEITLKVKGIFVSYVFYGCRSLSNDTKSGPRYAGDMSLIDVKTLGDYLDSDRSPEDCMGLSDLDGFLTGIVAGPELILPSEWIPVIWGDDLPEFDSNAEAETMIDLIMDRYNEIMAGFNSDPEKFQPICYKRPTGEVIVTDWAAGFLEAVEMRRAAWEPLFNHRRAKLLIEPIVILGDDGAFDDERDPDDRWKEFYQQAPNVIPTCVIGIYNFWKHHQQQSKPQPRRDRRLRR
jgi:uncharacterized protein